MICAARRVFVLLACLALGLLAFPDGRGLAAGGLAGGAFVYAIERAPRRRYLPARQLRRQRRGP